MIIGVGISGGVDSTAAAYLLAQAGHEVRGYTMRITDADTARTEAVAQQLDIPLKILDFKEDFQREILESFCDEYAAGRTPSPCVRCNRIMKFGLLRESIVADGCDCMATGHYARLRNGALLRGLDAAKDQSYFLAQVPQQFFSQVQFPLGEMVKSSVKELVYGLGLVSPEQGESQDLCFVNEEGFGQIVAARHPELQRCGDIVTRDGEVLGHHSGAFAYTIGQRRGLGLGGGPWFVVEVDIAGNRVIVGRQDELQCSQLSLSGMNWFNGAENQAAEDGIFVQVQLRYLMRPRRALLHSLNGKDAILEFEEPAPLVPAGQLAVAYQDERVVASGWIERRGG